MAMTMVTMTTVRNIVFLEKLRSSEGVVSQNVYYQQLPGAVNNKKVFMLIFGIFTLDKKGGCILITMCR